MKTKAYDTKLNDIPEINRMHLAWRLDHKTWCGLLTAASIARKENGWGDRTLLDVFTIAGECSIHSAKIHSKKVMTYGPSNVREKNKK